MPYILQPADFKIVQAVILLLVDSDWFDRTTANEKACTQLVLVMYGRGNMTLEALYEQSVDTAKELFSKPQPPRLLRTR